MTPKLDAQVWWSPECYHEESSCGAWHHPFRGPKPPRTQKLRPSSSYSGINDAHLATLSASRHYRWSLQVWNVMIRRRCVQKSIDDSWRWRWEWWLWWERQVELCRVCCWGYVFRRVWLYLVWSRDRSTDTSVIHRPAQLPTESNQQAQLTVTVLQWLHLTPSCITGYRTFFATGSHIW